MCIRDRRTPVTGESVPPEPPPALTEEQAAAVETLWQGYREGGSTGLLYGVTGSGKTAVYLTLAHRVRAEGRRCIVLVPVSYTHLDVYKRQTDIHEVLERIVTDIPAPQGDPDTPLQALIFDSIYDSYRGVLVYLRVMQGTLRTGMTCLLYTSRCV